MKRIERQQIVIIGGMHRSGTQMLAQLISAHGIPMWQEYSGHSEDKEFMDFHREILERDLGDHWMIPKPVHFSEMVRRRAIEVLNNRKYLPVWGWKDPRTTLFLDDWDQLIPNVSMFFIWRRCADVVASCMRRAKKDFNLVDAWNNLDGGLRDKFYITRVSLSYRVRSTQLWILYNQHLLQFPWFSKRALRWAWSPSRVLWSFSFPPYQLISPVAAMIACADYSTFGLSALGWFKVWAHS